MSIFMPSNVPFNHIKNDCNVKITTKSIYTSVKVDNKKGSNYSFDHISGGIDKYSNSQFNSLSNIFINTIASDITNTLKNKLSSEEYKYFIDYIIDKKLSEVINRDGTIKLIDGNHQIINNINKQLKIINKNKIKINFDIKLMQSRFKEIINKSSGLDDIVLENSDEYWIICSCCNDNSKEDVMAVSYALLYQITGSDELWSSLASLLAYDSGKVSGFDIKDIAQGESYYLKQRKDNIEVIKKYNNKGKKVYLAGFSLGGGIMLDSFARLKYQDSIKYEDLYLTLFNPFMSYLEIDNQKEIKQEKNNSVVESVNNELNLNNIFISKEDLMTTVKNSGEHVLIYSIEGDSVTQFSELSKILNNQIIYLKGNKNISYDISDINDAVNMITGENSRHGFKGIALNFFSKSGILLKQGDQISLNEVAGGEKSTNNLGTIMETLIDQHLQLQVGEYMKKLPNDQKWMENELYNIYFDFRHYLINYAGHYDSESLINNILSPLTRLLKEGALKENDNAFFSNFFINEQVIKESLKEYIRTETGSNEIKQIFDYFLVGNMEKGVNKLQSLMTNIYYNTRFMKYIAEIQKNYQQGYNLGMEINQKTKRKNFDERMRQKGITL